MTGILLRYPGVFAGLNAVDSCHAQTLAGVGWSPCPRRRIENHVVIRASLVDTMPISRLHTVAQGQRTPDRSLARLELFTTIAAMLVDLLMASIAVAIGVWWSAQSAGEHPSFVQAMLFVPILLVLLVVRGVYQRRLNSKAIDRIGPIETTIAVAAVFWLSLMVISAEVLQPGRTMVNIWVCAAVLVPVGRLLLAIPQRKVRRSHLLVTPTLIVGNGRIAHQIINRLESAPEYGLLPIGLLDDEAPQTGDDYSVASAVPYLGTPEDVEEAVRTTGATSIIIAFSRSRDQLLTRVIQVAHQNGIRVWVVPRMFDMIGERARIEHIGGVPVLALSYTSPTGWRFAVKHISDRVVAAVGLLAISPIFLTLMLLVRLSSPGPIFFSQDRVGRDGKVFGCLKFRTMRPPTAADAQFELQAGAAPGGVEGVDRRTRIGKVMRATSLDELPQLINVLRGEMSLVGPRPERPEFVDLFDMQIRRYGERHRVKAGVTGWAQVHGLRGQTSIADRAEWDNYYIENWSLALDLKILALTVLAVLRGSE
ncbi:hypothetical protein BH11ACT7_BH11ACT7_12060 [soil metagenome]